MLTAEGFKRKRYDEYLTEMEDQAKELMGADINLSDRSPLGLFLKLIAYARAEENELAEQIYNSAFVDTAEGTSLDHVGKYIGISRLQSVKSSGDVVITVDPGYTVSTGAIFSTPDGVEFTTTAAGTDTDEDGYVTVRAEAVVAGVDGNVPANTIVEINTPQIGIRSVTNPSPMLGGRAAETDAQFRGRYYNSLSKGGSSSITSIIAEVLSVEGVVDATIEENVELETNVDGVPGKSIAAFVYGGSDQDIAEAIFKTKPGGIKAYGTTETFVYDSMNNSHTIGFTRPDIQNIDVKITLATNNLYPINGDAQIRTKVVEYIGGVDIGGTEYNGLGLGDDVIKYKITTAIATIPGIEDIAVELSIDGGETYIDGNVAIETKTVAKTDYTKVVVV